MSEPKKNARIVAYNAENMKQIKINLNRKYDSDIIEYLATVPNIQGFIKDLIRERMKQ